VPEVVLRAATRDDVPSIAEVCNAEAHALYGEADVDATAVGGWFELANAAMFVAEVQGRLVGYADVRRDEEGTRFPLDVRVHPDAAGSGVADALVSRLEDWAAPRAVPGAQLRAFAPERDAEYRAAVERRGYELIRHSYTMELELPEELEPPDWPEGLSLRAYDPARDEEAVYEAVQDAFADHWDHHRVPIEEWRPFNTGEPRFDPSLWWLVEDGGELAAVSLNAWHLSGDPTYGWIETLGVRRAWRRRGLALALLRHSYLDFAARGATRVGLGVDAENTTGAVRLYERAGMRPVRRRDTWSRAL
jgi:mycothiol synthase